VQKSPHRPRYPRARTDLHVRPAGGQLALYDATGVRTQSLNFTAALVLTYCDGSHDPRAIADAVAGSAAAGADPDAIRADVRRILERFAEQGFLQ
jgi:hypothetical protein